MKLLEFIDRRRTFPAGVVLHWAELGDLGLGDQLVGALRMVTGLLPALTAAGCLAEIGEGEALGDTADPRT